MLPLGTVLGMRHGEEFMSDVQKGQEEALDLALDKLASAKVQVRNCAALTTRFADLD